MAEANPEQPDDKNKGGRPTLLNNDLILKAREYLGTNKHAKGVLTIEGLALELEVSRETLYAWERGENINTEQDLFQQFSDILTRVRLEQAEKLIQRGLNGDYNPVITKLLLTKHGYVDKSHNVNANYDSDSALPPDLQARGDEIAEQPDDAPESPPADSGTGASSDAKLPS